MRETHQVQASIFDFYSEHKFGQQLKSISDALDSNKKLFKIIKADVLNGSRSDTGRNGMSFESILRCMLLKQILGVSYDKLVFQLSDSQSIRTFARLTGDRTPCKSTLSTNIRSIRPETLEKAFDSLAKTLMNNGDIDLSAIRIDSTVVESNILKPNDSQLLNDCVRVLCRLMAKSKEQAGLKVKFTDHRKTAKSLAYRIFNGKKAEKDRLYKELLPLTEQVIKQAEQAIIDVNEYPCSDIYADYWIAEVEHYVELAVQVVDQTRRRVIYGESVPSHEKIVSIFEEHTDIIVKGARDVQYGHKLNVATDVQGFLTHIAIEEGNPSDADKFISIIDAHQKRLGQYPESSACDGCYASQDNVANARDKGVKRVVFNKKRGIGLRAMGVKQKTFDALSDFRAGIEGNISELKRAFGLTRAMWKGYDGFKSYVLASAMAYNLMRLARVEPG